MRLSSRIAIGLLGLLLTVSLVAYVLVFGIPTAHEGAGVVYVNETDVTVDVFDGDDAEAFVVTLAPHSSVDLGTFKFLWDDVVTVKDQAGRTLMRRDLTWDELEAQDFRIVITADDLEP